MALLAKYYLTYNSPMGVGQDTEPARGRTYHAEGAWRPSVLVRTNGPTSAPASPRTTRKSTWVAGNRSSCETADGAAIAKPPRRSYSVRRVGSTRRNSPFRTRRGTVDQRVPASAPTSPHFGFNKNGSNTKLPAGEKSMPSSPLLSSGDPSRTKRSPPISATRRRSNYESLRLVNQNQSFTGVNESPTAASTPSPPHSGGMEAQRSPKGREISPIRGRCASGPLNPEDGIKAEATQPTTPELLITLSYSKNTSFITATVNKARNLSANSGAFVRIHLYEGFKPISLKQTTVVQSGAIVEFKQAFMFSLAKDAVWATHVLIELFEQDVIGNEWKYGDVVIGPKAGGNGFLQWRQACMHPNIPCSMWHTIT